MRLQEQAKCCVQVLRCRLGAAGSTTGCGTGSCSGWAASCCGLALLLEPDQHRYRPLIVMLTKLAGEFA
jgi:hypothetical protein